MRRLYLQIYLGFLVVVAIAVLSTGVAVHLYHRLPAKGSLHSAPGLVALLAFFALVLAAGSYPIARRITHRLEAVRDQVAVWGAGELSARAPIEGDDEVAQLAARFNEAAARVESLVDQQRRMLASASHELRTPLARLRLTAELLRDDDADAAAREQLLADARRDIAELDALVGELLAAARAEDGRSLTLAPVEVGVLVSAICEAASIPVAVGDDSGYVLADGALVRRAVRNLIDNARRHGGGDVRVTVARIDGAVRIAVDDAGPPIPAAAAERLFEPFFRPQGHDEGSDGGVGLGLALVRQIATAHGGRAGYTATERESSSFWVELPAAGEAP